MWLSERPRFDFVVLEHANRISSKKQGAIFTTPFQGWNLTLLDGTFGTFPVCRNLVCPLFIYQKIDFHLAVFGKYPGNI